MSGVVLVYFAQDGDDLVAIGRVVEISRRARVGRAGKARNPRRGAAAAPSGIDQDIVSAPQFGQILWGTLPRSTKP